MTLVRLIVAALPQLLLLLAVGGALDLLGGWNHTDGAMGALLGLIILSPVATALLLGLEAAGAFRQRRRGVRPVTFRPGLAALLFAEALVIDGVLLTQMRM